MATPTLSVLHISDLHITADKNSKFPFGYDPDQAKALARFVHEKRARFQSILVTGDLAHTGRPGDLKAARKFIFAKANAARGFLTDDGEPTLQGAGCPIHVMPGNHDRYRHLLGGAGNVNFDQKSKFGTFWKNGLRTVQAFEIPVPNSDYVVAFLVADCCLPSPSDADPSLSPLAVMGQGLFDDQTRDMIRHATETLRRDRRVVVLVLHFPPVPPGEIGVFVNPSPMDDDHKLIGHAAALDLAEELDIPLIVSGHLHVQECFRPRDGRLEVWCAGTPCAREMPAKAQHMAHIMTFKINAVSLKRPKVHVRVTRENFHFSSWNKDHFTEVESWDHGHTHTGTSWIEEF